MSFFITAKNIDHAIEKLEGKVWDNFQVANTLANAPVGILIGKNGQIHCIKEWTEEVRQRRKKEYCIVDNIGKALVIAGFLTGVAALVLLSFSVLAATAVGGTALGFGVLLLLTAIVAVPQEERFGEQALLRVQKLWRGQHYEVALAKMAKLTQRPEESDWQLDIFKEYQSRSIRAEAGIDERERPALLFAAFLLPHSETQAQSRTKAYTLFNNSEIQRRLAQNPHPSGPPGGFPLEGVPHDGEVSDSDGEVSDGEEGDNGEEVSYGQEGIPDN